MADFKNLKFVYGNGNLFLVDVEVVAWTVILKAVQ